MFGTYEIIVEPVGLSLGSLEHLGGPRSDIYLRGLVSYFGRLVQQSMQAIVHVRGGNAELSQNLYRDTLLLLQQSQEHVLAVPLAVAIASHDLLGTLR